MTNRFGTILLTAALIAIPTWTAATGGITPEEVFQPTIDWGGIPGTWEILPQDDPLAEPNARNLSTEPRAIMTLREDGTCRVINKDHRAGSDGLWTHEGHKMFVTFPDGSRVDYFVYGIRGDFMITRSPYPDGRDELWARVR